MEVTITVGDTYIDAGATSSDDIDGDITTSIVVVNPVDINTVGDYIITYNISDVAGNNAIEVTRSVHVVAIVPPPPPPTDITPPEIIMYDLDGTTFDLKFSEEVSANIDILDSDGNAIKHIYDSPAVTNPRAKIWDRTDEDGKQVLDGIYTIKIIIIDSAGNSLVDTSKTITIDNSAPEG